MEFEVYCDESTQDAICSTRPDRRRYLLIGSIWLLADLRTGLKASVAELRDQHDVHGEIKWSKVSRSKMPFYKDLIDLFFSYGEAVRFRCIAVDSQKFDKRWHNGDDELGFYKCYYQLLHHWVSDFNEYRFFCDIKTSRDVSRLSKLRQVLSNANLSSEVTSIQALPSREVVGIQVCDLLLGASAARLNSSTTIGSARHELLQYIETKLGREISSTWRSETKFNVFVINLQGGW